MLVQRQINQLGWVFRGAVLLCFLKLALKKDLVAKISLEIRLGFPRHCLFAYRLVYGLQMDHRFSGFLSRLVFAAYAYPRSPVELFIFALLLRRCVSHELLVSCQRLLVLKEVRQCACCQF